MLRRYSYIVSACRTPIGSFNGSLATFSAPQLGIISTNAAFERCPNVPKDMVNEFIYGNVCSANIGQSPARQVALGCHLPTSVTCTTINKVCASGLKTVSLGAQSIELGQSHIVVTGGMESMSNVPYYCPKTRFGARTGNVNMIDGLLRDGLTDAYENNYSMGAFADKCARDNFITRKKQDDYAVESYERAATAYQRNIFNFEIVSIEIHSKKGGAPTIIEQDEGVWKFNEEKLRSLKPAFNNDGTVTAANSSQISDGAATLILVSEDMIKELNLKPLAKILSYADAEQEPSEFCTTPTIAFEKVIKRAGLDISEIGDQDFFEISEAFAVVGIVNRNKLKLNPLNTNVYGGAVALGHPIGCSGARILVTLITALKENAGRYGIASICNGGGGATAVLIENLM